jgi:GNAT superfamily N-acetyltransferase
MWRVASVGDDERVVAMFMALNAEDPGPAPVLPQQMRRTLSMLRREQTRGRAVVCDIAGDAVGYALLISFWSNELGGEVCTIDELFVLPEHRGRGLGTALLDRLAGGDRSLWPAEAAALALEVTPRNQRARALYERLGFEPGNLAMRRLLPKCSS